MWFDEPESDISGMIGTLRAMWVGKDGGVLEVPDEKRPLGLFERLLQMYAEKYPRESDPFEVVRNEHYLEGGIIAEYPSGQLRLPTEDELPNFQYCGIIDRVVRFDDGSEYVMDTKTTSGWMNEAYWTKWEQSVQMAGYMALRIVHGHRCDGCYIDAIQVDTRYHKVAPKHLQRQRITGRRTLSNR
jgi:hypothetical protein